MNERCQTNHKFIELVVLFEVSCYKQLSPYLEKKKAFIPIYNIHSYLQRSQIYNHFLKASFPFFLRMALVFPNENEELYKNEMQEKIKVREWEPRVCFWNQLLPRRRSGHRQRCCRNHLRCGLCCSPDATCLWAPAMAGCRMIPWRTRPFTRTVKGCVNGDCLDALQAALSGRGLGLGATGPWPPTGLVGSAITRPVFRSPLVL